MMLDGKEIKIGQNYKIFMNKKLGAGAFGEIFSGIILKTREEIAVKLEPMKSKNLQLSYEYKILKQLQGEAGIPKIYHLSAVGEYNAMVMEFLGPNLEELFNTKLRKFSLNTIINIGFQTLALIELIHSKNYIHRDIKPENFLIGAYNKIDTIHLIDFGLAKRYCDPKTGQHILYKDGKSLTGTARYASIYTHLGIEQSRRDDLEGLGYVLIYFIRGELPWQGLKAKSKKEKYLKIMEKKISITPESLCKGYPDEFTLFFNYCRGLQFDEKPNYIYLRSLLKSISNKFSFEIDKNFDWKEENTSIKNDYISENNDFLNSKTADNTILSGGKIFKLK